MNRLFGEMDRLFGEMWTGRHDGSEGRALEGTPWVDAGNDTGSTLERLDDEYVFVMDLPGFEREEIDLAFDEGTLSIRAARDADEGNDGMRSFRSRRVEREVHVPAEVLVEECTASYHNGVLEVHLPVEADDEGGHRIDIE